MAQISNSPPDIYCLTYYSVESVTPLKFEFSGIFSQVREVKEKALTMLKKKKYIAGDIKDLEQTPPLALPETKESSAGGQKARKLCSYKEMWKRENAVHSLQTSGLYEAGGSGLWMTFNPLDKVSSDGSVPHDKWPEHIGSWAQLQQAKALFSPSPHATSSCLQRD